MEFTKDIKFNNMPTESQCVKLTYQGFLADSSELWVVYGFGEAWEHTTELKMSKSSEGFYANIDVLSFDTLNFCFRNSSYVWDNNSNCNYISPILPYDYEKIDSLFHELITPYEEPQTAENFDIDTLIEEILQPILIHEENEITEIEPSEIRYQTIDLGVEIGKILSQITCDTPTNIEENIDFSSLDEILSGTVIEETSIELFEETNPIESNENSINEQTSLVKVNHGFIISHRQLSKFYLFKKRIKLALYKVFIKLPKLIFGSEEQ